MAGSIRRFRSALDIAELEYLANRLSEEDYLNVGDALKPKNASDQEFLPDFAACPKNYPPMPSRISNVPKMRDMRLEIDLRMKTLCNERCKNPNWRRFYDRQNCAIVQ